MLCCWDRGQSTPVHDHGGSRKWIKILEGEMQVGEYPCEYPCEYPLVPLEYPGSRSFQCPFKPP